MMIVVPSMFGRDLIEQVRADWRDEQHYIPVIVEKCIDAVDLLGKETVSIWPIIKCLTHALNRP